MLQCFRQLLTALNRLCLRVLAVFDDLTEEITTFTELHHQVVSSGVFPVVQKLHDVRMVTLQRRRNDRAQRRAINNPQPDQNRVTRCALRLLALTTAFRISISCLTTEAVLLTISFLSMILTAHSCPVTTSRARRTTAK